MEKILIIDDEPSICDIVQVLLVSSGYSVKTVGNGKDGIELAKKWIPDLIILDIMMPGMSGYMVAKHFSLDETLAKVPILLLTATANVAGNIMLEMPTKYRITKPFDSDDLVQMVHKIFSQKKKEIGKNITFNPID